MLHTLLLPLLTENGRALLRALGLRQVSRVRPLAMRVAFVSLLALGLLGIAALGGVMRPITISQRAAYQRYFESFLPAALLPWR